MINLQDFITESLVQIVSGVRDAQKKVDQSGAKINPTGYVVQPSGQLQWDKGGFGTSTEIGQTIEFDIAVVATDDKSIKGGIGVFGAGVSFGYQAESGKESSVVSRVKFSVPVFLPPQKV